MADPPDPTLDDLRRIAHADTLPLLERGDPEIRAALEAQWWSQQLQPKKDDTSPTESPTPDQPKRKGVDVSRLRKVFEDKPGDASALFKRAEGEAKKNPDGSKSDLDSLHESLRDPLRKLHQRMQEDNEQLLKQFTDVGRDLLESSKPKWGEFYKDPLSGQFAIRPDVEHDDHSPLALEEYAHFESQRRESEEKARLAGIEQAVRNALTESGFVPASEQQSTRGLHVPSKLTLRKLWAEITKHPGRYFLAFLLSGLPLYVATIWQPFMGSKTVSEWLAENGWPRLRILVATWLASIGIIAIVIVWRAYQSARCRETLPVRTNEPPETQHRETRKRDFLVERLTDFTKEASQSFKDDKFGRFNRDAGFLEVGLWRRIEKFLQTHLPSEVWRFNAKGIDGVEEIIKELLDGWDGQPRTHKLTFEVDTEPGRSKVSIGYASEDESVGLLEAEVLMRFWNTDIHNALVTKLSLSIFRQSTGKETPLREGFSKLTWRTGTGESRYFSGHTVPASSVTEDYWFRFTSDVRQDVVGQLDRDCVLRLRMEAARQASYWADFPVSWSKAKDGETYLRTAINHA